MKSPSQKLTTNSFVIMLARLVGPGGSFLFWALVARTLTATDMGLASAIITGAAFLSNLAQLGIGFGLVRFLSHTNNPIRLTNLAFEIIGAVSILITFVFIIGVQIWSPALVLLQNNWLVTLSFLFLVFFYSLNLLLNSAFLARRLPSFSVYVVGTQTILSIIFFIPLAYLLESYQAVILAYLISVSFSFFLAIFYFLPRSEPGFRLTFAIPRKLRSPFSEYAFTNYVSQQFLQAPATIITLVAVNIIGPNKSGYFFIAWTVTQGLLALAGSVALSLFSEGSVQPQLLALLARKALKLGGLIAIIFTLLIELLGGVLLAIYGPEYVLNSLIPLRILALSIFPSVTISIFFSILRIQVNLRLLITIAFLWSFSSLFTTTVFMSEWGINGAALGWTISQFALAVIFSILGRNQFFPSVHKE